MDEMEKGQISTNAAEVYEEFFVPALFSQWSAKIVKSARIKEGDKVVDVSCGTGVLAREVAKKVGSEGHVVGVDLNDGMLAVAARIAPHIEWRKGDAEKLPLKDDSYDAVVSQFGMMFYQNRVASIHEMFRVTRPGGRLAVAVWDSLNNTPGYAAMTELLEHLFGVNVANALRIPYNLGDVDKLREIFIEGGINNFEISTYPGKAIFPSIESWVHTDIRGWTLSNMINEEQYQLLLREAKREFKKFIGYDGKVTFSAPAHIVVAHKV